MKPKKSHADRQSRKAHILATIQAHAATSTYAEIAAMLGVSRGIVVGIGYEAGVKKPRVEPKFRARMARAREVVLRHARTHTLAQMGRMLGVTRERVRRMCVKWEITRPKLWQSPLRGVSDAELHRRVQQPDKRLGEIARELAVGRDTL